jgi:hypothetical protein
MNNLKTYENFVNESIFHSEEDDIAQRIYDAISQVPDDRVTGNVYLSESDLYVTLRIGENKFRSDDPYGEENWGNAIEVHSNYSSDMILLLPIFTYTLKINNEELKASFKMKMKIHNLMKNKFKRNRDAVRRAEEEQRRRNLRGAVENL